jgi:dihydrofolate synthase/folylpolyglutamate synthase
VQPGNARQWSEIDAERWLLSLENFGIELGLERIEALLAALGSPQRRGRIVHVVGSNGKSSVTRMIEAILREHGLVVGAYLSPHFISFTERILINGSATAAAAFAAAAESVNAAAAQLEKAQPALGPVTQFEALTAIAFSEFERAEVEAAVIEAGLGGRLDATNVTDSAVQVCTGISLEHTALLGATTAAIAAEKLAVVRPGSTLVVGADLDPAALSVAVDRCAQQGARLVVAGRDAPAALSVGGDFQRANFALAAAGAHALLGSLDSAAVERAAGGLLIPGRYEIVGSEPTTIFDGAHNDAGAAALLTSLAAESGAMRTIGCLSVLDDKDAEAMLTVLGQCSDELIFTRASHPRALDPAVLAEINERLDGPPARVVQSPHEALEQARLAAGADGLAFAAGSLYLIADLKRGADATGGSTL